jgi:hypothetical protein
MLSTVCIIDAKLFETICGEIFKSKNIQNTFKKILFSRNEKKKKKKLSTNAIHIFFHFFIRNSHSFINCLY